MEPIIPSDRPDTAADEYHDRVEEARDRLVSMLHPRTDEEHDVVRRIGEQLDLRHLTVLCELIEYITGSEVSS